MRKLTKKKIQKWCETNLKSEEEKKQNIKINSKTEKEYLGIKYFLYDMENAGGSRWIALEADFSQFQGWELDLINALQNYFEFTGSFLRYHSRDYEDHKLIEVQKEFLDGEEPIISKIKTERSISVFELLNKDPMDFEDIFDRSFRKKIQDYKKSFDNYEFSTIELRDYSLDAAVEIFTRINTGGTILTLFEIMAAKTYDEGKNFDMQEKYKKFKKELKNKDYDTIRPRNILDVLALIISGDCTRNEILNLDKDDIINKWDDTIESIKCTIDYFKAFFKIPVSEILPYDSLFVPFSYFFYKNKFNNPNKNQADLLRKYFWNTSLTYRFSSATASKLKNDAERIDLILN